MSSADWSIFPEPKRGGSTQEEFSAWLRDRARDAGADDPTDRRLAEWLTARDPLAHLRNNYCVPSIGTVPGVDETAVDDPRGDAIYLCGNSLGLMPKATRRIVNEQLDKWDKEGVFGHFSEPVPWAECDERARPGVATLVGASEREVLLANGLTVNIHVLLAAFYVPTADRHRIVIEQKAFPSDHYAVQSQIQLKGYTLDGSMVCLEPRQGEYTLRTEDVLDHIDKHGDRIAILWLSAVQYFTGQLFDIPRITEAAHAKGCLVGWDLAHAYMNVPLRLHDWNVDFAVWCSYKYGCSGAGGLAGLFVHDRFARDVTRPRMLGWFAHKIATRFQMTNELDLEEGASGFRISNPPIMLVAPLLGSLEAMRPATMDELRRKSFYLTGYLEFLVLRLFGESSPHRRTNLSIRLITPSDFSQRGCQLSLLFSVSIDVIYKELVRRGVAVDKRYPSVIRVSPVHLYNNWIDVNRFVRALEEACLHAERDQHCREQSQH